MKPHDGNGIIVVFSGVGDIPVSGNDFEGIEARRFCPLDEVACEYFAFDDGFVEIFSVGRDNSVLLHLPVVVSVVFLRPGWRVCLFVVCLDEVEVPVRVFFLELVLDGARCEVIVGVKVAAYRSVHRFKERRFYPVDDFVLPGGVFDCVFVFEVIADDVIGTYCLYAESSGFLSHAEGFAPEPVVFGAEVPIFPRPPEHLVAEVVFECLVGFKFGLYVGKEKDGFVFVVSDDDHINVFSTNPQPKRDNEVAPYGFGKSSPPTDEFAAGFVAGNTVGEPDLEVGGFGGSVVRQDGFYHECHVFAHAFDDGGFFFRCFKRIYRRAFANEAEAFEVAFDSLFFFLFHCAGVEGCESTETRCS